MTTTDGFLMLTKTALVKALQGTFNGGYPVNDFRDLHIDIEFPVLKQHYPCVWVDFEPTQDLVTAGINHTEYTPWSVGGTAAQLERWRFFGTCSFTVVALSSAVRDRLADQMIRVFAFGRTDPTSSLFRTAIEQNPYVAMDIGWDKVGFGQMAASPGTPWGSDEYLYEVTLRLGAQGEFVSNPSTGELIPISQVEVFPRREDEDDLPAGDGWF